MKHDMENPATMATRGAPEAISLAAITSESKPKAIELQDFRASFVARKFQISRNFARTIAALVFGRDAR
ncbi:hypothetical protein [Rhodoblastus sp.]|uniref:hypothetical protein n=1 Tax=Rhodoblastus sp. TaxID=1962975 RepID=UPI003F976EBA